jgi:hypothetical protein
MDMNMRDTFAVDGNTHILFAYLSYFENQIESTKEYYRDISQSPNYYAWLSLASHLIYYRISELLYFNEKNADVFNWGYSQLVEKLFTLQSIALSNEEKEGVILFVEIRHSLVHKGFPNFHNAPASNGRPIGTGIIFNKPEVNRVNAMLQSPKSYLVLKETFRTIIKKLNSLQSDEPVELR